MRRRVHTLREILGLLVVPLILVAAIAAPQWFSNRIDTALLKVSCQAAHANTEQLKALREVADELGVPVRFMIPPIPEECS